MSSIQMRPYQERGIEDFVRATSSGLQRGIISMPTGTGKTVTGILLMRRICESSPSARALWIAHRDELISQPVRALSAVWPSADFGVVKADRNEADAQVVFASIQTICRPNRLAQLGSFDLIVVDECHHAPAKTWTDTLRALGAFSEDGPDVLGLTATPERSDQAAMDSVFEDIVYQFQLKDAIPRYLVDVEWIQGKIDGLDLDEVKFQGGDWHKGELESVAISEKVVDSITASVLQYAEGRRTLLFSISVEQSRLISEKLCDAGIKADWVAGITQTEERRKKLVEFSEGKIQILCNCMLLTEGYDEPAVECLVIARPTQSRSLYMQMLGRGLRIAPGKTSCRVVDLVGVSKKHSLIQAPVLFGLDPEDVMDDRDSTAAGDEWFSEEHKKTRLLSQVDGVWENRSRDEAPRSRIHWVKTGDGFVISVGHGKMICLTKAKKGEVDEWTVGKGDRRQRWHVTLNAGADSVEKKLSFSPVDLELATGIAEDYCQRLNTLGLIDPAAAWRRNPASPKQLQALRKMGHEVPPGITKGEASDIITQGTRRRNGWKGQPATEKQLRALLFLGHETERQWTKGEASRVIGEEMGRQKRR